MVEIGINGFGRIGRLLARELIVQEGSGNQLRLRAVAVRSIDAASLHKRASLLKIDSVHGDFPGTLKVDEENLALIINGRPVYFIPAPDPTKADYTNYGINKALLIDNSGAMSGGGQKVKSGGMRAKAASSSKVDCTPADLRSMETDMANLKQQMQQCREANA